MDIIYKPISQLIDAEYNPRKLDQDQYEAIKSSLLRFGFTVPALVNAHPDRENIIIGGHQRKKIVKAEYENHGTEFDRVRYEDNEILIPCVERALTPEEERELNIRLNKNTGSWDDEMLMEMFEADDLIEWGFAEDELDFSFEDLSDQVEDDEFDEPLPEDPTTEEGDIYQLGEHRLICGSSTDPQVLEKLFEGEKASLVVTDPPYNVDYEGGTEEKLKIKNDDMSDEDFYQFLFDFYSTASEFVTDGAAAYIFHADTEGANFRSAFVDSGFKLSQCLVWVKNSIVMGRQDYHWQHEPILYGWKPGAGHKWYSNRKQSTVLEFDRPTRSEEHPNMKPLPLIAYLIGNSSRKGDLIFDGFLGSGSSLISADQTERICYGCDLDPRYCDVIIKRYVESKEARGEVPEVTLNGEEIIPREHFEWEETEAEPA